MEDKNETLTAKALNHIKENGNTSLEDICTLLRRSKNNVRSLLSKQVSAKTLFVKQINGLNSLYSDVPFKEDSENIDDTQESTETLEVPKVEVPKVIELPPKEQPVPSYVTINGLGTVSEKKLSEWFAEGILTVNVDKLVAKMKTTTLSIEKDKIIFGV